MTTRERRALEAKKMRRRLSPLFESAQHAQLDSSRGVWGAGGRPCVHKIDHGRLPSATESTLTVHPVPLCSWQGSFGQYPEGMNAVLPA